MPDVELCAACGAMPAIGKGEHVWPKWFLKRMDAAGPPPSAWAVNGKPVLNRTGHPIQRPIRSRVLLPMCGTCNTELDRRVEKPAKDAIERLASNRWAGGLTETEWRAVGLWWTKVLLMIGHSRAKVDHEYLDEVALRFEVDPYLGWLTDGSPVPDGLSLFVFRADREPGEPAYNLVLPNSVRGADGITTPCVEMSLATGGLCVTVVSHPGVEVVHPLVTQGSAWELLHAPPSDSALSDLPELGYRTIAWMRGGTVRAGHVVDGSESAFLTSLFDHQAE